jgi:hypothetical protein
MNSWLPQRSQLPGFRAHVPTQHRRALPNPMEANILELSQHSSRKRLFRCSKQCFI